MNISLRALRRGVALQRTRGSLLAAAVAYSASAYARLAHKELTRGDAETYAVRRQNKSQLLTENKGSSEAVGSEAVLIRSRAEAGEGADSEFGRGSTQGRGATQLEASTQTLESSYLNIPVSVLEASATFRL